MSIASSAVRVQSIKRSGVRKLSGKLYYRMRRYAQWYFGGCRFAAQRCGTLLPEVCASHSTPLIRRLANVDMWMQRNKITNLRLAAAKLNGVVLLPGETFSYWKAIGKPARWKGYLPGMVLAGGGLKPGTGGGLCQMSNLIYWMTLHTPLTVTERHRHSYDVFPDSSRTQPFGSGATCSYNYLDLQIRNDTNVPFQLVVRLTDELLTGCWRCAVPCGVRYEVYERDAQILSNPWGGYIRHNAIWRRAFGADGELLDDEFISENNALMMYQPLLGEAFNNPT